MSLPADPPPWAKSCANPVFPYTNLPYPAYPGHPLSNLDDWKSRCLEDGQLGNCAFLNYATFPSDQTLKVDCHKLTKQPRLLPSVPHTVSVGGVTLETVCFDNFKDKPDRWRPDRLCIFQNFVDGNVNVEQMGAETRARNLQALIEGYAQEVPVASLPEKRFCFHKANFASVGWTHMHVFDKARAHPWPDGLTEEEAYCSEWKGSGAQTAAALHAQVAAVCRNDPGCAKVLPTYDLCCPSPSGETLACCA
jgi:hypothetical protein